MIITLEKKTDIVDHTKVVIPANYVLILPNPEYNFYHNDKGEEIDLMVGKSIILDMAGDDDFVDRPQERVDTLSQHYSVRGRVFAVPEKLRFLRKEINRMKDAFSHQDLRKLTGAIDSSLEYDTDLEVSVGDEVIFDYLVHIGCYEDGRWIETELGDMFLVKYDELHMVINPDGVKKPINGWMVITREEKPNETESGLALFHKKTDDITKSAFGYIIDQGTPIKGYKDRIYQEDDPYDFRVGQRILYRPGGSRPLEWVLHQTLYPGKKALIIHRRDVFYAEENVS